MISRSIKHLPVASCGCMFSFVYVSESTALEAVSLSVVEAMVEITILLKFHGFLAIERMLLFN